MSDNITITPKDILGALQSISRWLEEVQSAVAALPEGLKINIPKPNAPNAVTFSDCAPVPPGPHPIKPHD